MSRFSVQLNLGIIAPSVVLTLSIAGTGTAGQTGEWRAYAADHAGSRYAPLGQINTETVHDLEIAWRQSTVPEATRQGNAMRAPSASQNTPLMARGLLYISTGLGVVAALDASTGEVAWVDTPSQADGVAPPRRSASRGVSYWTDGNQARVLAVIGSQLVALDADTGERDLNFGDAGAVDLIQGYDDREVERFRWRSAPLVVNDMVIIGSMIGDIVSNTMPALKTMPPGDVRGFDVRTGEQRWIFHTIPREGETGNETWLTALNEDRASWEYTGNTNMWASPSADEELNYVYLPLSTPTSDYYGGHRPGDNLFAESLVCLDAATGERIWHFQAVHHGLWDYDFPAAPNLVDIEVDGRSIKALAQISKQGFLYVFDRVTGEPVWPIEERAVPASVVPGEQLSTTQPFPTKPAPLEELGLSVENVIDFTPELAARARELAKQFVIGPIFTPPSLVSDEPDKYPTRDTFAPITSFHHRRELDAVQRELREFKGVSVIIYDQTCATEKRRRRNPAVCEGCGDCGEKSNCLSVLPKETELGRKREIDQNACNKDYSCVEGFCPSFVTVHGGGLRKPEAVAGGIEAATLPEPQHPSLERPWNVLIPGVGGRDGSALAAGLFSEAGLASIRYPDLDRAQAGRTQGGTVPLHPVVHVVGCYHGESSVRFM